MKYISHSFLLLICLAVLFASCVFTQDKKVEIFDCRNQVEIEFIGFEKIVGEVKSLNVESETLVSEGHVISPSNEGNPELFATYKYDRQGRLSEKNFYRSDGVALPKQTFDYDSDNKLIRENYFSATTNKPYLETIYKYENGLLKEIIGSNIEKNDFLSKQVFSYDKDRNYFEYIETKSYTDRKTKVGFIQDSKCRFSEIIGYTKDGQIVGKNVISFDDKDNPVLTVGYSNDGKMIGKRKFEYEFDKQGNWIKQSHYSWEEENGKSDWKLMRIEHRKIKYYKTNL